MRILMLNSISERISTGQIMYELYTYLKNEGNEIKFFYGRGKVESSSDFVKMEGNLEFYSHVVLSRLTGLQGFYSNLATTRLLKYMDQYKPQVVVLGNIHGYYLNAFRLLKYLKKKEILTVYYMFDEHAFLGKCAFFDFCENYKIECCNCPKKKAYPKSLFFDKSRKIFRDKLKVYSDFKTLRFVSVPYTVSRSLESALFKKSGAKVYPFGWGINTNGFFRPYERDTVRAKLGIPPENKVVLAVAPYSNGRKGIASYYYPMAQDLKNEPISFVHVGFDGKEGDVPSNVIALPFVKEQKELAEYFSLADLFVITSISEGYPTVCLDALSCGTPICGFNISGTPHVAGEPYGQYVEPFDTEAMKKLILEAPLKDDDTISACRKYAQENLDSNAIFGKLFGRIKEELREMQQEEV